MSTTCNFGQVKDARFSTICVGSKKFVDRSCNVNANKITAKTLCSRTIQSTGTTCTNMLKVDHIKEKSIGGNLNLWSDVCLRDDLTVKGNIKCDGLIFSKSLILSNVVVTDANTTVAIQPVGTEEWDPMSVQVKMGPCNGFISAINMNTGVVCYKPNPGFIGSDVYEYCIVDSCGFPRQVTQHVCVKGPSNPPLANNFCADITNTVLSGPDFKGCANVVAQAVPGTFPIDLTSVEILSPIQYGLLPNVDAVVITATNDEEICVDFENQSDASIATGNKHTIDFRVPYRIYDTVGNPSNQGNVIFATFL